MKDEAIKSDLLAALDIAAMERLSDGEFELIGAAPRWLAEFVPQAAAEGARLRPQDAFMFLEQFLTEAETFWESDADGPLRSGVWTEAYAAGKHCNLEASALKVGEHRLLVIERLRSAYGDIQALAQKARDKNLDYDRLRRTEEALRKSEERYRDLFENATDLIQSCAPDGKLMYANRAWCEALGYTADEIPKLTIFDIIHPTTRQHCQEVFNRVMSGEKAQHIEAMFVTKDGNTIRVEGNSSCRFKDGKPYATRSIFRDITERYHAEQALRKSEQQLQAILDNSTAVIYLKDYWGRYILVNNRFENLFHIGKDLVVGKSDFDLFPREMAEAFRANDVKVLEAGTAIEWEEKAPQDDGPHTYLSVKFPLCDSAGVAYAVCGISTDITERKRMEVEVEHARDVALESARLKAEFLANMSHEI
ncbi:MAG TPA: PAS domain S-box protein, partial [Blastocatellia bacterium]|nr:PAS domain S-box protein [Blastocatellia bacterium]